MLQSFFWFEILNPLILAGMENLYLNSQPTVQIVFSCSSTTKYYDFSIFNDKKSKKMILGTRHEIKSANNCLIREIKIWQ